MNKILNTVDTILMDVEGTTTSKDFVFKVLFPYSYERLPTFIEEHANDPIIKQRLEIVHKDLKEATQILQLWIKEDRKDATLKYLQGLIWEEGYQRRELTGHIYDDVKPSWDAWKKMGKNLAIYSSGSVLAQKMIFTFSNQGNLSNYLNHHFDTSVGLKREASSYEKIADIMGVSPDKILFLSDIEQELEAATVAGFKTILINRDETPSTGKYTEKKTFSDIE